MSRFPSERAPDARGRDHNHLSMDLGLAGQGVHRDGCEPRHRRGDRAACSRRRGRASCGSSRSGGDFECDVTDADAGERILAECVRRFGRVDVLVNNAGTSRARSLEELTDADWAEQWELNVMAPMRLMSAVAPRMAEAGEGRIVNVASSSGKRPSPRNAAYSVTKAARAVPVAGVRRPLGRQRRAGERGRARAGGDTAVAGRRRSRGPEPRSRRGSRGRRRSSEPRRRSRSAGSAPRTRSRP